MKKIILVIVMFFKIGLIANVIASDIHGFCRPEKRGDRAERVPDDSAGIVLQSLILWEASDPGIAPLYFKKAMLPKMQNWWAHRLSSKMQKSNNEVDLNVLVKMIADGDLVDAPANFKRDYEVQGFDKNGNIIWFVRDAYEGEKFFFIDGEIKGSSYCFNPVRLKKKQKPQQQPELEPEEEPEPEDEGEEEPEPEDEPTKVYTVKGKDGDKTYISIKNTYRISGSANNKNTVSTPPSQAPAPVVNPPYEKQSKHYGQTTVGKVLSGGRDLMIIGGVAYGAYKLSQMGNGRGVVNTPIKRGRIKYPRDIVVTPKPKRGPVDNDTDPKTPDRNTNPGAGDNKPGSGSTDPRYPWFAANGTYDIQGELAEMLGNGASKKSNRAYLTGYKTETEQSTYNAEVPVRKTVSTSFGMNASAIGTKSVRNTTFRSARTF